MIELDKGADNQELSIDLTALIDIIFILLVFLMLTANTQLLALPVDVPTNGGEQAQVLAPKPNISVNVMAKAPYWAIDGHRYAAFSDFSAEVARRLTVEPELEVIVAADKQAEVQLLLQLLAMLQAQKISQTQILMEP
ncbi:MAG: ExbD/TolR family protein [Shewanella sp.]